MRRNSFDRNIKIVAVLNCFLMLIIISVISLGIARIVIGFKHLDLCEGQPMIPIYLIVSGVSPCLLTAFRRSQITKDDVSLKSKLSFSLGVVGIVFNISWLVAGSIWVYGTGSHGDCIRRRIPNNNTLVTDSDTDLYTLEWNDTTYKSNGYAVGYKDGTSLKPIDKTLTVLAAVDVNKHPENDSLEQLRKITEDVDLTNDTVLENVMDNQTHHAESVNNTFTSLDRNSCIVCDDYLLSFSFAIVTFDWILLGLCVVYLSISCVRRTLKYFGDYDCPFL